LIENPLRVERTPDYAYDKYIVNIEDSYQNWRYITVSEAFAAQSGNNQIKPQTVLKNYHQFIIENAHRIFRFTSISDSGAGQAIVELKYKSKNEPSTIMKMARENLDDVYVLNGQQISFYSKNVVEIDGKMCASKILTDVWDDIAWEGIANEGNVKFKKGKKPERLLRRCLDLVSKPGDLVLDSFLGSGTTASVAHKMKRKYIGIEFGEHCFSLCYPRLKDIVEGEQTGISKVVDWKGGNGFKFYELAPSLLEKDKHGQLVINKEYNANMLAAAMAKHEGFTYSPSKDFYWKQGQSSEQDFIYTTTQFLTVEALDRIYEEMAEGESLLICCTAFQKECQSAHSNISIKKIPKMLLGRCEFGKDNYNLNIISLPDVEDENESEE
jgi:adenine-specific DNA-methyltransferase